ncbi:hypothetical protein [Amycolatopsis thermoflava]|uniref:hypothetical protein n=1 Tax=Amycolatopsis thermoflava TaxID=84480 RepID=UPI000488C27F|nr:hypothetical protein [Amycolatopsis thermoflava]
MRRTVYSNTRALQAVPPAGLRTNGTVNGTTIDRWSNPVYFSSVMFVVHTGTVTDGSHAVAVQESDNGSAWSAAAAGDVQGTAPTITSANGNTAYEVGYVGSKRYTRITLTTSGATTGGFVDAVAICGIQPTR